MNGFQRFLSRIFGRDSEADIPERPEADSSALAPVLTTQDARALNNKGANLAKLGRHEEALVCYGQALAIDPLLAAAWFSRALAEEKTGRVQDAVRSYERFIATATPQDGPQIVFARRRLEELGLGGEAKPAAPKPPDPTPLVPTPETAPQRPPAPVEGRQKGDMIGPFEVQGVLDRGGFSVVYLVHFPLPEDDPNSKTTHPEARSLGDFGSERRALFALKTIRDEYLADPVVRQRFRQVAHLLVDFGHHPYLLPAHLVLEIGGRLYIASEYIVPDEEGLNSLEGYLSRRPPDLVQSLRWAIQCCNGMEYAYSKGLRCHRNLKPANILITRENTVKITGFGLSDVLDRVRLADGIEPHSEDARIGLSGQTQHGAGSGTPTHMPPEQFTDAPACDERSDVYAFGVVSYQMATGGQVPFQVTSPSESSPVEAQRFWNEMQRQHRTAPVPLVDSPLLPIIQRCLAKEQGGRYHSFRDLRTALELLLQGETGEVLVAPVVGELTPEEWRLRGDSLAALDRREEALTCFEQALAYDPASDLTWNDKGRCLAAMGRQEEALDCYDQALALDPQSPGYWSNKGNTLSNLGRREEALVCFDRGLTAAPQWDAVWSNKGLCLADMGRQQEALVCYKQALALYPQNADTWYNRANALSDLGQKEKALACYNQALKHNPQHLAALNNKATTLAEMGRYDAALGCLDQALGLDPNDAEVWGNKGLCFNNLGRLEDANACFARALALNARLVAAWNLMGWNFQAMGYLERAGLCFDRGLAVDAQVVNNWIPTGVRLGALGYREEALACFDRALSFDPQDETACCNKGLCLVTMGRLAEAIACYEQALTINPRFASAWYNKGRAEERAGRVWDAERSYEQFLDVAPAQYASQVEDARRRLRSLRRR